jgi:hypothetical protein
LPRRGTASKTPFGGLGTPGCSLDIAIERLDPFGDPLKLVPKLGYVPPGYQDLDTAH